jgi:hypothetical protein
MTETTAAVPPAASGDVKLLRHIVSEDCGLMNPTPSSKAR